MMESFKVWLEELGLADAGATDQGAPKIKNKKVHDKYKIPSVPTYSFEKDRSMASKTVEARQVGEADTPKKKKTFGLPKYTYDVTHTTSTRLDPGS